MRQIESENQLREVESLRTRLSMLSEASRRVSESLDLGLVLQEVIDNARYLTGARYGALLTYDQSGGIQDFMTSGLSPQEIEQLKTLPQGLGLLGYMNEIREPLRLADIAGHPSSVGFPEGHPPMRTFLGMPVRHHGEHVGNIYLTEKEDGREFTGEDQDTLVMFASQAGAAIINARRHRDERQARADMEAVINTSPVGVLVFDGKTGDLLSANDETRRIVGRVNTPGRSLSQLLDVLTLRRPDGSDIPIEQLPTVRALKDGETVIADEVVIYPPDGRAITTLVNARPIRGEDGEIVSVVATIQDITSLEEIKRQRNEFLGNVSHELRTPLSAIKGSTSTLLNSPYPLDPSETRQFLRVIDEQSDHMRHLIDDLVDMTQIEAGTLSVNPEPTEVADLIEQAREAHVHAGPEDERSVELDLPPDLPRVMADRRRIHQVLVNLLASVAASSPRSSTLRIGALATDENVAISVRPAWRGRGHTGPHATMGEAFHHGRQVRGGRDGSDFAICVGIVEAHGGRLSVEAGEDGRGSAFTFTVPAVAEAEGLAGPGNTLPPFARDSDEGRALVLAVGDDYETRRYIRNTLSRAGFTADAAGDPEEAERLIETRDPHVVILEPSLARADGLESLARVGRISDAPVIFVAGPGWERHIGRAFELGAVDYMAKPFTTTELVARVEMALRRRLVAGWTKPSGHYVHGGLAIDYAGREVSVAGRPVHLTATEYKLLAELSTAAGRVVTHEQILRRVWGPLHTGDARIIRTYIKDLRLKLGDDAAHPTYIFTELGVGYHMARPSTAQELREGPL